MDFKKFDIVKIALLGGLAYFVFGRNSSLFGSNSEKYKFPGASNGGSSNGGSNNGGGSNGGSTETETPSKEERPDDLGGKHPNLDIMGYLPFGSIPYDESKAAPQIFITNKSKDMSYIIRGVEASYFIQGRAVQFAPEFHSNEKEKTITMMDDRIRVNPGEQVSFDFGKMNCYFGDKRQYVYDACLIVDGKKQWFKKTFHELEIPDYTATVNVKVYIEKAPGSNTPSEDCPSFNYSGENCKLKYMSDTW